MTHDEMIAVITHHKDGGKVQCRVKNNTKWHDCDEDDEPLWEFATFDYRAKPEPMTIYAEICDKKGILMRTSKVPIDRIYSGTIIKKFVEDRKEGASC